MWHIDYYYSAFQQGLGAEEAAASAVKCSRFGSLRAR